MENILATHILFATNAHWWVGDSTNVDINQEKEEKNVYESILLELYSSSCFFTMERVCQKKGS